MPHTTTAQLSSLAGSANLRDRSPGRPCPACSSSASQSWSLLLVAARAPRRVAAPRAATGPHAHGAQRRGWRARNMAAGLPLGCRAGAAARTVPACSTAPAARPPRSAARGRCGSAAAGAAAAGPAAGTAGGRGGGGLPDALHQRGSGSSGSRQQQWPSTTTQLSSSQPTSTSTSSGRILRPKEPSTSAGPPRPSPPLARVCAASTMPTRLASGCWQAAVSILAVWSAFSLPAFGCEGLRLRGGSGGCVGQAAGAHRWCRHHELLLGPLAAGPEQGATAAGGRSSCCPSHAELRRQVGWLALGANVQERGVGVAQHAARVLLLVVLLHSHLVGGEAKHESPQACCQAMPQSAGGELWAQMQLQQAGASSQGTGAPRAARRQRAPTGSARGPPPWGPRPGRCACASRCWAAA
jgi:hypothetical protein